MTRPIREGLARCILQASEAARTSVHILSPFVSCSPLQKICERLHPSVTISLVTRFDALLFARGSSDIRGLATVAKRRNSRVYGAGNLHAKVYVFDGKQAIVTSANCTQAGWYRNWEYGIETSAPELLSVVNSDLAAFSEDTAYTLAPSTVQEMQAWLETHPLPEPEVHPADTLQTLAASTLGPIGWKNEVYAQIVGIPQPFKLDDVYALAPHFQALYPNNQHINDKLRQVLQQLRDKGLVEFLGNGTYQLATGQVAT